MNSQHVIDFWFNQLEPAQWFRKDEALDRRIKSEFAPVLAQAKRCELWSWRESALGALAEVIVLDQFSRNIHRDQAAAFEGDPLALALAQAAIARGFDQAVNPTQRGFFYMPFMHSESPVIHHEAVTLFRALGHEPSLRFEYKHQAIIEQFGRYPHRNAILGRPSSAEELAFLQQPGSSF